MRVLAEFLADHAHDLVSIRVTVGGVQHDYRAIEVQRVGDTFPQQPADTAAGVNTTTKKKKQIEGEWDKSRKKYKAKRPLMFPPGTEQYAQKTNHRVPKAAGGCPTGKGNLKPDSRLSEECQKIDAELTEIQSDAAKRWQKA